MKNHVKPMEILVHNLFINTDLFPLNSIFAEAKYLKNLLSNFKVFLWYIFNVEKLRKYIHILTCCPDLADILCHILFTLLKMTYYRHG